MDIRDLATKYAVATEWNLATLEELNILKGTSKSRIARQRGICIRMLGECRSYMDQIDWRYEGTSSRTALRAYQVLQAAKKPAMGLDSALDQLLSGGLS